MSCLYRLLSKYHPKKVIENQRKYFTNVKKRVGVFEWFHERSKLQEVPLVLSGNEAVVRTMDMAVILIEGGNENDFKALDMPLQEAPPPKESPPTRTSESKRRKSKETSGQSSEEGTVLYL